MIRTNRNRLRISSSRRQGPGIRWLLMMVVLSLLLTGCGGPGGAQTSGGSQEKVLRIANGTDMLTFDIHNHGNATTGAIHVNLFEFLVNKDREMKKIPGLATSWQTINDTTTRFKLKQGVKFQNGDPFTSADVKFTLERVAKDTKLSSNGSFNTIKEVNIVDEHTVDIVTHAFEPLLLVRLSSYTAGILPSKYIQEKGWDYFYQHPIGTGPYKYDKWIRDDRVELVKNDDYYGDKPKWDRLVFRSIPEASTRVGELLSGGVDIAGGIPPSDMERVENQTGTHTTQSLVGRVLTLIMRTAPGYPTSNPKVREAIDLAINKESIVKDILGGAGVPIRTPWESRTFGSNPSLYNTSVYDKQRAKELLVEAGYPNGLELNFSTTQGRNVGDKETAEMIAGSLREVGFKVNLQVYEWSKFQELHLSKQHKEIYLYGYGNEHFDAGASADRFTTKGAKGRTDYSNPEVDKLIEAAARNTNPVEREKQYQQVQDIIAKERPEIFLFQQKLNFGVKDRIEFQPRLDEMLIADQIILKP
jgi:peptide/nickel transport system substrate-binding protein